MSNTVAPSSEIKANPIPGIEPIISASLRHLADGYFRPGLVVKVSSEDYLCCYASISHEGQYFSAAGHTIEHAVERLFAQMPKPAAA